MSFGACLFSTSFFNRKKIEKENNIYNKIKNINETNKENIKMEVIKEKIQITPEEESLNKPFKSQNKTIEIEYNNGFIGEGKILFESDLQLN